MATQEFLLGNVRGVTGATGNTGAIGATGNTGAIGAFNYQSFGRFFICTHNTQGNGFQPIMGNNTYQTVTIMRPIGSCDPVIGDFVMIISNIGVGYEREFGGFGYVTAVYSPTSVQIYFQDADNITGVAE